MPNAFVLGLIAAVLEWVPVVGSIIGCMIVVLVAATDLPNDPWVVYAVVGVFVFNRLLDNFVFMPLTVGRSLRMHPLPTVLMIFIGGAVAGIPGLILALPLAGVVRVVVGTIGGIVRRPATACAAMRLRSRCSRNGSPPISACSTALAAPPPGQARTSGSSRRSRRAI